MAKLLKIVRDITQHFKTNKSQNDGQKSHELPHVAGSSSHTEDAALEFIKHVCVVLALDRSVQHNALVERNFKSSKHTLKEFLVCSNFKKSVDQLAKCWMGTGLSTTGRLVWQFIPVIVTCVLWTEHNKMIFEKDYAFKTDMNLGIQARSLLLAWTDVAGIRLYIKFSQTVLIWDKMFM
ncbi:hypothetical protein MKX01_008754 [Papaver californicum]|nr:hypothetical protein MKX01_008754 [Papaver californicum]